jgi:alkylhydroperoxidase family enzyme
MRIDPLTPPYSAEVQAQFDQLPAAWQPPFEHFTVLARDPRLLRAYRLGSVAYLEPSHLSIRQREVFLLRVTGRCRNAFEWCLRVHYFADGAGMTEAQLHASVYGCADDACWETGDRVLIRLADELHDTATISDALWSELHDRFSDEAILQLILLAGHYRTNAYVSVGLQVPVDPRVKRPFPAP